VIVAALLVASSSAEAASPLERSADAAYGAAPAVAPASALVADATLLGEAALLRDPAAAPAADTFESCADAYNFAYNSVRNSVSAAYNSARCERAVADRVERALLARLPTFLGRQKTSPGKLGCVFEGGYVAWLDTALDEYADCQGSTGFERLPVTVVADAARSLLVELRRAAPSYVSAEVVEQLFSYDFREDALSGTRAECRDRIEGSGATPPEPLASVLASTVCNNAALP
jgi:hypothetical protein